MRALTDTLGKLTQQLEADVRDGATAICVNRPNEAWVKPNGAWSREPNPFTRRDIDFNYEDGEDLVALLGAWSGQHVSPALPLMSCYTPDGWRVQAIIPDCAPNGTVSLTLLPPTYNEASEKAVSLWNRRHEETARKISALLPDYDAGDLNRFMRKAVHSQLNILVCGSSWSGKTTFLSGLLRTVDMAERVVTVERAPELKIPQPNNVRTHCGPPMCPRMGVTQDQILEASLRMHPDRLVIDELDEPDAAFRYIIDGCINIPGSMTTFMENTVDGAVSRLLHLILASDLGRHLPRQAVVDRIAEAVDVVVALDRFNDVFKVSDIWFRADAERRGKDISELLS